MRAAVFLGPSLPREEALRVFRSAVYYPPAARGDIAAAADSGFQIIGLIDGVFYQQAAVSHREILDAMSGGIRIFGGSSMGALRASELDVFGMVGVGKIYEWYKSGKIRSDDEVALAFHPMDYRPLSEPLVNTRATLERLFIEGRISLREHDLLLGAAKAIQFQLRNPYRIIQKALHDGLEKERGRELLDCMLKARVDLKREDALMVLKRIKDEVKEL
ncbi:MAG: TfuA-related McrA-glycine thioamidation protein [Candidatus Verstraetearchaeota archaeon]|nr:TfuA-related McrA-glycine thioamidation protein [Candidatus Verstraetearchaeota archaeon]